MPHPRRQDLISGLSTIYMPFGWGACTLSTGQFFWGGGSVNDLHVIWWGLCTICRSFWGFCTTYRSFFEVHLRSTCQLFLGGSVCDLQLLFGASVNDLRVIFGAIHNSRDHWGGCLRSKDHFWGIYMIYRLFLKILSTVHRSFFWDQLRSTGHFGKSMYDLQISFLESVCDLTKMACRS